MQIGTSEKKKITTYAISMIMPNNSDIKRHKIFISQELEIPLLYQSIKKKFLRIFVFHRIGNKERKFSTLRILLDIFHSRWKTILECTNVLPL